MKAVRGSCNEKNTYKIEFCFDVKTELIRMKQKK